MNPRIDDMTRQAIEHIIDDIRCDHRVTRATALKMFANALMNNDAVANMREHFEFQLQNRQHYGLGSAPAGFIITCGNGYAVADSTRPYRYRMSTDPAEATVFVTLGRARIESVSVRYCARGCGCEIRRQPKTPTAKGKIVLELEPVSKSTAA